MLIEASATFDVRRMIPERAPSVPISWGRGGDGRRDCVAQLAGVGVTWYTWLEQGRDIKVSERVLDAVARTLDLDAAERDHLFVLANRTGPEPASSATSLPSTVQTILDELYAMPACVLNARSDVLAYNRIYGALIADLDAMPPEDRNTVWLGFTCPASRNAMVEWEDSMRRMVAQLRSAMADHVAEPAWKSLIRRLKLASPEFASMWARHEVQGPENRTKTILSPHAGLLRLDFTNLWFGTRPGTRLLVYTPADDATRDRLHDFASRLLSEECG
jgi:transcription regulator MmyB-like protein/helix-turn-helix protein